PSCACKKLSTTPSRYTPRVTAEQSIQSEARVNRPGSSILRRNLLFHSKFGRLRDIPHMPIRLLKDFVDRKGCFRHPAGFWKTFVVYLTYIIHILTPRMLWRERAKPWMASFSA